MRVKPPIRREMNEEAELEPLLDEIAGGEGEGRIAELGGEERADDDV